MPKVLENIQFGFAACRIGMRKCWQWLHCYKPVVLVREQYEVLCLGLSGAGKSTALATLVGESTEGIEPTSGFNIKTLPLKDTVVDIKELGGSESVRSFWNRYFQGQHGLFYVVNAASDDGELKVSLETLQTVLSDPALKGIPCVILATHQDMETAKSQQELEQFFHNSLAGRKWQLQVCGLQDRNNVQIALEMLLDLMASPG